MLDYSVYLFIIVQYEQQLESEMLENFNAEFCTSF